MDNRFSAEINRLIEKETFEHVFTTSDKLEFADYVVDACRQNACGRYGSTWNCPPAVGELSDLKKKYITYKNALVFTTNSPLEDSYDVESMEAARISHTALTDKLLKLFRTEGKETLALGAGSCARCDKCTYPDKPCRFPNETYPSVEAVGIDVVALSKTLGIHYFNGTNTVTFFSVILYR